MEGSLIHFGKMGEAGYQAITNRMLPLRGLDDAFDSWRSRLMLAVVEVLQPRLRAWMRNRRFVLFQKQPRALWSEAPTGEFTLDSPGGEGRESFLNILMKHGWKPSYRSDLWDLEKYDGRVLMATERGNAGGARILVRYRGKDPRKSVTLLDQSSKKV
jgi:hypothetical protein